MYRVSRAVSAQDGGGPDRRFQEDASEAGLGGITGPQEVNQALSLASTAAPNISEFPRLKRPGALRSFPLARIGRIAKVRG